MTIEDSLFLWCMGFNIDPVVLKRPAAQQYIEYKDAVGLRDEIRRHGQPLNPTQPKDRLGDAEYLELSAILNENDKAFLMAVALGGKMGGKG